MEKTYLVIDSGNTSLKYAYFIDNEMCINGEGVDSLRRCLDSNRVDFSFLGAVASEKEESEIMMLLPNCLKYNLELRLPIQNKYQSPKTLGVDRLANAVAGTSLSVGKNVLIVDAGTCLKFDFVTKDAEYLGGSIAPGLQMRFKALHHFTARLPLLKIRRDVDLIGSNTEGSIQSGVLNGMQSEIFQMIRRYQDEYGQMDIYLTGGDCERFEIAIKNNIFAHKNLTLLGLKLMLEANV